MGVESPDGDYSQNDTIARKRAESIAEYLKEHTILTNCNSLKNCMEESHTDILWSMFSQE